MSAQVFQITVFEDGGAYVMGRVLGNAGTAITQATISGITYYINDLFDGSVVVASTALTVSSVVFDTYQTSDPRWTEDTTGYNFATALPAGSFPSGNRVSLVTFKFDPVSGEDFYMQVKATVLEVLGS